MNKFIYNSLKINSLPQNFGIIQIKYNIKKGIRYNKKENNDNTEKLQNKLNKRTVKWVKEGINCRRMNKIIEFINWRTNAWMAKTTKR